jgi:integrase
VSHAPATPSLNPPKKHHVRERTLLVERAVSDGQLKVLKNRRQPRTGTLLAPLQEDLDAWRHAHDGVGPLRSSPPPQVASGEPRTGAISASGYRPVAESVGLSGARPYDLRHAFASLLIHEGRLSVVEIAAQLGHNPTVCLDTYAHVLAEQSGGEKLGAEEQIAHARRRLERGSEGQLSLPGLAG